MRTGRRRAALSHGLLRDSSRGASAWQTACHAGQPDRLGVAVPPSFDQAELWDDFFAEHYGHGKLAGKISHNCGVEQRHGVADPRRDDLRFRSTEYRMHRFLEAGLPLGVEAVGKCLDDAGLDRSDVGLLTVVSCTGYGTPGIDIRLAGELGFDAGVQRLTSGTWAATALRWPTSRF